MSADLRSFLEDFAAAMQVADARRLQASSKRSSRVYQAGIGPHGEDEAVDLIVAELKHSHPERYRSLRTRVPYAGTRQKCDLTLGEGPEWAIEVKMARLSGDNGKPDDTSIKDILSPYDRDRSALSDCRKLAESRFAKRAAILIYGFEDARRPLNYIIEAFEILARKRIALGPRIDAPVSGLVHPVFTAGRVFAWEVCR